MARPHFFRVIENVYCVMRKSYFTCSYLVTAPNGLIAIDAGMKSNGSEMLSAISELGKQPKDVTAILLTHWHNDHAAGACELAALSGADVFYSQRESDHLTRQVATGGVRGSLSAMVPETGPLVLLKGLLGNAPQRAVEATRFVNDGDVVAGDFDVIGTPGHTVGHLSYYHRSSRTLFCGDAMAVIRGRLRFMARPVTEDLNAARESMIRCLDRPIDAICPGHREPLSTNVASECQRMRALLASDSRWPLLG
jgi:glyoxylase-like metal-dependent hydrolase (beta-lactamase superfamily II)